MTVNEIYQSGLKLLEIIILKIQNLRHKVFYKRLFRLTESALSCTKLIKPMKTVHITF